MNPYPGEVWLADLGLTAKNRPIVLLSRYDIDSENEDSKEELNKVLVVSRYDPDPPRSIIIYIPLTTQYRESRYEVSIPKSKFRFLQEDSYANVQGIGSIPKTKLYRKLGDLSDDVMAEIKQTILYALDIENDSTSAD